MSCGEGRWSDLRLPSQEGGLFSVAISWTPPEEPRGILTVYSLSFTTYDGSRTLANVTVNASVTNHTFTALSLCKPVCVRGRGMLSLYSHVVIPPTVEGVPYNVSVSAMNTLHSSERPCYFTDFLRQLGKDHHCQYNIPVYVCACKCVHRL